MPRKLVKTLMYVALSMALVLSMSAGAALAGGMNLRLQSHMPPQQAERTVGKVITLITDMTDGNIKVALHPTGAIVPTKQLMEAVGNGILDMATVAEGYQYKLVPVSEIAQGLPFAFENNSEAAYFMYQKGYLKLLRKAYEKFNIYVLPYEPFNVGLMTNKPILKADDLKGMKIRAYGTMQKWLNKLGATTTYIPGGELYTALSTSVVDGAHWGDAFPMYELKLHEVLKNYMKPEPVVGSWNVLWINLDTWKKFTPTQQAIIESAARAGGNVAFVDTRVRSEMALQEMQAKWKVKVNQLPEAEVAKMRAAAQDLWAEIANNPDPLTQEAFKMLYQFLAEVGRPVK